MRRLDGDGHGSARVAERPDTDGCTVGSPPAVIVPFVDGCFGEAGKHMNQEEDHSDSLHRSFDGDDVLVSFEIGEDPNCGDCQEQVQATASTSWFENC